MDYVNLRPSQVRLDPSNPRLPDGTQSDKEAINRLLDEGADALNELARDMASSGESNPSELPIVLKEGRSYLVLEGNRRFAALKLLNDPALADQPAHRKMFERAATLGDPPKRVYCLLAPSREAADRWIVLRHTGENRGVGIRRWNAPQAAAYRRRARAAIDAGTLRSITIADELEETYARDAALVDLILEVRRNKLTNIGRLFAPDVMDTVGLSIRVDDSLSVSTRTLMSKFTAGELHSFFMWAFQTLQAKTVDDFKNRAKRTNLLLDVRELIPVAGDDPTWTRLADQLYNPAGLVDGNSPAGASPRPKTDDVPDDPPSGHGPPDGAPGSGDPAGPADGSDKTTSPGGNRKRDRRPERYLFQDLRLPNHNARIQSLLKQCRLLEIDTFPDIACVMARVVVELAVSAPEALTRSGAKESDSLKVKIRATLKYLDPEIEVARKRNKTLEQSYLEAEGIGIEYLNGFVHNPATRPDAVLARRFSSAFAPLLSELDVRL